MLIWLHTLSSRGITATILSALSLEIKTQKRLIYTTKIMEQVILKLNSFAMKANPDMFYEIFQEHPTHLWNKFKFKCSYDVICFYMQLDDENRRALIDYISKAENI